MDDTTTAPATPEADPTTRADRIELTQGGIRDAEAETISITQGGISTATAQTIDMRQGGIARAAATDIAVTSGGVGLAQGDTLHDAVTGSGAFAGAPLAGRLRVLFSPVVETFLVLTTAENWVPQISELKGRRINIGPPASGSEITFRQISSDHSRSRRSTRSTVFAGSSGFGCTICRLHERLLRSFASATRYVCISSSDRPAL